jgi:hypothetical protein
MYNTMRVDIPIIPSILTRVRARSRLPPKPRLPFISFPQGLLSPRAVVAAQVVATGRGCGSVHGERRHDGGDLSHASESVWRLRGGYVAADRCVPWLYRSSRVRGNGDRRGAAIAGMSGLGLGQVGPHVDLHRGGCLARGVAPCLVALPRR